MSNVKTQLTVTFDEYDIEMLSTSVYGSQEINLNMIRYNPYRKDVDWNEPRFQKGTIYTFGDFISMKLFMEFKRKIGVEVIGLHDEATGELGAWTSEPFDSGKDLETINRVLWPASRSVQDGERFYKNN